jgi:lipid-A-disaccharide synthase-like uncharacterized protein
MNAVLTFLREPWNILGIVAQGLFASRFLVQWMVSEIEKKSIIPLAFWYFSLAGGVLLFAYAVHRQEPVFAAGQGMGLFIYLRNLWLIYREKGRAKATDG